MQFKTYITCTSHPDMNIYFESNTIREIDSNSAWDAVLDIVHEAGEKLLIKRGDIKMMKFDVSCRIDEHSLMIYYSAIITFKKSSLTIDRGFHIPLDSMMQEIFPTKVDYEFEFELIDKGEALNGFFPGERL